MQNGLYPPHYHGSYLCYGNHSPAAASPANDPRHLSILLLTPTARDGEIAAAVLHRVGFEARICPDMETVCNLITHYEAGVLLIAEESLTRVAQERLLETLDKQPPWSDIPIILLTWEGHLSDYVNQELSSITTKGNVTLLERPVRAATLNTVIASALRARERQLDVRDHLERRRASEIALRDNQNRLKELAESERIARKQAEEANAIKSNFLATMSHELRTPLNAISGYTELMKIGLRGPITDAQREDLERIDRSQRHLLSLINDILNFAKIEAGHVPVETVPVDMHNVLKNLDEFVGPQIHEKGLKFKCGDAKGVFVYADEDKMRQILLNLLSNAIKFTPEGGNLQVECWSDKDTVFVKVSDDGAGIPADKLEAIFEPFVQVGRDFSSTHQGTGLGLAISRDLARKMNGDLTVESKLGYGSSFVLSLPRVAATNHPAPTHPQHA